MANNTGNTFPKSLTTPNIGGTSATTSSGSPLVVPQQKPIGLIAGINPSLATNSVTKPAPTSPGKYKGVTINPGSQAQIQAQMAAIDAAHATTSMNPPTTGAATGASAGTGSSTGATTQTATTAPQASTTSPTTTFGGLVSNLAGTSTAGSQTAPGYISSTANYGAGNIPIGQSAADIAASYGQKIADVGQKGAAFEGGELTTGTSPVAQGNAAITANLTAQQQQALATGEEAALQGTSQQLTAQQQAASAANQAAGQANTSQGLVQSGLTSAGTLAQPSGNFPFVFDPTTGSYSVSGGNLQGAISGGVQQAISNPALYTSLYNAIQSTYGDASAGMFQQAYIQAGGNPQTAAATGAGQAASTQAVTSAGGTGQASAISNLTGVLIPAYQASTQVKSTIDQFLNDNPSLNTTQLTAGNALQQWLQGQQLGDPNVQTFLNDVSEYVQTLAPVLGVGGTPTDAKAYTASQFINAQASGQSIQKVLSNIETLARNKLSGYQAGATGTTVPSITSQSSSNSNDPLGIL